MNPFMSPSTINKNTHTGLRLFLDSADTQHWQTWLPSGLFYGITTNPVLLQRAKIPCTVQALTALAEQAFSLGIQEIQLQTWGTSSTEMLETALQLAAINPNVVVKIPATKTGTEVAATLIDQGVRITLTAVYAVHQVLTAAALKADYAAPYLGRINDMGRDGRQDLIKMQQAITGVNSSARILVASIRTIDDITVLTAQGLNTFTFSANIAAQWFDVAATEQAAADFEQAAEASS